MNAFWMWFIRPIAEFLGGLTLLLILFAIGCLYIVVQERKK